LVKKYINGAVGERRTFGERIAKSRFLNETKTGNRIKELFVETKTYDTEYGIISGEYVRSNLIFGKEKLIAATFKRKNG
jgi:hypothetical protein